MSRDMHDLSAVGPSITYIGQESELNEKREPRVGPGINKHFISVNGNRRKVSSLLVCSCVVLIVTHGIMSTFKYLLTMRIHVKQFV